MTDLRQGLARYKMFHTEESLNEPRPGLQAPESTREGQGTRGLFVPIDLQRSKGIGYEGVDGLRRRDKVWFVPHRQLEVNKLCLNESGGGGCLLGLMKTLDALLCLWPSLAVGRTTGFLDFLGRSGYLKVTYYTAGCECGRYKPF